MHIIILIVEAILGLVLTVIVAAAGACVLVSPVLIGRYLGERVDNKTIKIIEGVLVVIGAYGAYALFSALHGGPHGQMHGAYWAMALFFVPIYTGLGISFGLGNRSRDDANEKSLANWQNQLTADRQADAGPVRLAADYQAIAKLLKTLKRNDQAIDEYRQAIALLEPTLGSHPSMAEHYNEYLGLLDAKSHADEIARITAKREALPQF